MLTLISVLDKGKPRVKHSHSKKQQMHADIMHTHMTIFMGQICFPLAHKCSPTTTRHPKR